eukprot:10693530-Alexandrium_andersonii.AAC.1
MTQAVWQNLAKAADSWRFRAELVRTVDLLHRDERPELSQPTTEQVAMDGRVLRLQLEQVGAAVHGDLL